MVEVLASSGCNQFLKKTNFEQCGTNNQERENFGIKPLKQMFSDKIRGI